MPLTKEDSLKDNARKKENEHEKKKK